MVPAFDEYLEVAATPSKDWKPRGLGVSLPHGGLPEVTSPYLWNLIEQTGGSSGPIGLQFISQPDLEKKHWQGLQNSLSLDPLDEEKYTIMPGLIYKYRASFTQDGELITPGRALITLTYKCASYCRFCFRGDEVGKGGILSTEQRKSIFDFIAQEPGLNEVILSGGDPLTLPEDILEEVVGTLAALQQDKKITIVRIGTRLPIHNPYALQPKRFEILSQIKNLQLMLHINHPYELTAQSKKVLDNFRFISHAHLKSQTVLLKGVNDDAQVLRALFYKLFDCGVVPYHLLHNDGPYWATHFDVPREQALGIWKDLFTPHLSGVVGTVKFMIDVPGGKGKVSVPQHAWVGDTFADQNGDTFLYTENGRVEKLG